MKCKCGYKTDNGTAFATHARNGCKLEKYTPTVTCPCGKVVKVTPSKQGRKKFCSKKCRDDNYVRPFGIIPNFKNGNKGWFKAGEVSDSNHPNWVGDKVKYNALHTWIHRKLGKACRCDECGKSKAPEGKIKFFQWANISGEYKRELSDWRQLCAVCHRKFDGITKLSKDDAKAIRIRYSNGELQSDLGAEYKVDPSTISNIVNNKIKYYVS